MLYAILYIKLEYISSLDTGQKAYIVIAKNSILEPFPHNSTVKYLMAHELVYYCKAALIYVVYIFTVCVCACAHINYVYVILHSLVCFSFVHFS